MKRKNNKRRYFYNEWVPKYWSGSRYELTLNQLMSRSLKRQFAFFLGITLIIFLLMWLIGLGVNCIYCRAGSETKWNFYTTFVQLTNPNSLEDGHFADWIFGIAVTLFGLFIVNGIVVTVLVNWLSNRRSEYENGQARYSIFKKSKFAVIIGGHPVAASLIKEMNDLRKYDYILIQTKRDPEELRRDLLSVLDNPEDLEPIIIYFGERTSKENLKELNLESAKEIFIIGESRKIDGTSHDAINLKSLNIVAEIVGDSKLEITPLSAPKDKAENTESQDNITSPTVKDIKVNRPIPCNVMFDHQSTFTAFQFTDVELKDKGKLQFMPFNIYEIWAQQVIVAQSNRYIPLDGNDGIRYDSPERVHLIIVGMSREGVSLAVEAAHACHFPNFLNKSLGHPRTLITFIDLNADREMNYFKGRFNSLFELSRSRYVDAAAHTVTYDCPPHIDQTKGDAKRAPEAWIEPWKTDPSSPFNQKYPFDILGDNFVDVDWEFIKGDIADPAIRKYLVSAADDEKYKTSIAICIPDDAAAASAALYMPEAVYSKCLQILVYQSSTGALITDLSDGVTIENKNKYRRYDNLRPFGMLKSCRILQHLDMTTPSMINYIYNDEKGVKKLLTVDKDNTPSETAVDALIDLRLSWEQIKNSNGKSRISKIWSSLYSANSIPFKLRSVGISSLSEIRDLSEEEIKQLSLTEHNRWNVEELLIGFRPVLPCDLDTKTTKALLKTKHIHMNIQSNERLREFDSDNSWENDRKIVKNIPNIVKAADIIKSGRLSWPDNLSKYVSTCEK